MSIHKDARKVFENESFEVHVLVQAPKRQKTQTYTTIQIRQKTGGRLYKSLNYPGGADVSFVSK